MSSEADRDKALTEEARRLETTAATVVPILDAWLRRLHDFADDLPRGAQIAADDHFAFMAIQFHAKQVGHAEAVLLLGPHPDGALVARSMLEGLCLLKWALQDDPHRAMRWRNYVLVINWRIARDEVAAGVAGAEARLADLATQIAAHGDAFLNSRAIGARAQGRPLPADPYVATWYNAQLRQVFEDVGAGQLYEGPYYIMSEWHHWSPGGLGQAIRFEVDTMTYSPRSPMLYAGSLSNAFQCLVETTILVNDRLALGRDVELAAMVDNYVAESTAVGFGVPRATK